MSFGARVRVQGRGGGVGGEGGGRDERTKVGKERNRADGRMGEGIMTS